MGYDGLGRRWKGKGGFVSTWCESVPHATKSLPPKGALANNAGTSRGLQPTRLRGLCLSLANGSTFRNTSQRRQGRGACGTGRLLGPRDIRICVKNSIIYIYIYICFYSLGPDVVSGWEVRTIRLMEQPHLSSIPVMPTQAENARAERRPRITRPINAEKI